MFKSNIWKCTNCGIIKHKEEEVLCWSCGIGEMIYITPFHWKTARWCLRCTEFYHRIISSSVARNRTRFQNWLMRVGRL